MPRWRKGEDTIQALLERGHLQQVAADAETAETLVATSQRHVQSATMLRGSDPDAAFSLAYDAARKAATALLAHQGLRPTTAGGHLAVVAADSWTHRSSASSSATTSPVEHLPASQELALRVGQVGGQPVDLGVGQRPGQTPALAASVAERGDKPVDGPAVGLEGLGLRYETAKKRRGRAEARWAAWWLRDIGPAGTRGGGKGAA